MVELSFAKSPSPNGEHMFLALLCFLFIGQSNRAGHRRHRQYPSKIPPKTSGRRHPPLQAGYRAACPETPAACATRSVSRRQHRSTSVSPAVVVSLSYNSHIPCGVPPDLDESTVPEGIRCARSFADHDPQLITGQCCSSLQQMRLCLIRLLLF